MRRSGTVFRSRLLTLENSWRSMTLTWHYMWPMQVGFIFCRQRRRMLALERRWNIAEWQPRFTAETSLADPLQSDRCSAAGHWAVPQVCPFVDDFRQRTDTLRPGTFDLAPTVAMAASQMGYLSPNRPPALPPITTWRRHRRMGCTTVGLHGLSRLIRVDTIRYCACRSSS